jgi:hypothetical protein
MDCEILFHWNHLDWLFPNNEMKKDFNDNEYWKGAMAAGFKIDREGNYYLSVPRWAPGIPASEQNSGCGRQSHADRLP